MSIISINILNRHDTSERNWAHVDIEFKLDGVVKVTHRVSRDDVERYLDNEEIYPIIAALILRNSIKTSNDTLSEAQTRAENIEIII